MSPAVQTHDMQRADAAAFETSDASATCNHCVIYTGNKRDDSALEQANASQRASHIAVSFPLSIAAPPALLKNVISVAKAHGPPGDTGPLYVLLNVFRI